MTAHDVSSALEALAIPEKATHAHRFFKTGPGEYGEGDTFIGLTMPQQRKIAKEFKDLPLAEVTTLLKSPIHEYRMTGLLILTYQFPKADKAGQEEIYDFYIKNLSAVNNWDLVDVTTPHIIGMYMIDNPNEQQRLTTWATSPDLWARRIAILATFPMIHDEQFDIPLQIAEILVNDKHDLIHKAVGWMLREIGKKNQDVEEYFLRKFYKTMPRTMLRYAIEKFDEPKRKRYLAGSI